MLDEIALRRPEFDEAGSIGIVLADGQTWFFPRPAIELFPTGLSGKLASRTTLGPDFDRAIDALISIPAADDSDPQAAIESEAAYLSAQFRLAALMLSRNYQLEDADWKEILRFSYQSDTYKDMWDDIFTVARGSAPGPKPTAATSAQPSL